MPDRVLRFAASRPGRAVFRRLPLAAPVPLRRHHPGDSIVDGPVVAVTTKGGRTAPALDALPVEVRTSAEESGGHSAVVLDATGLRSSADLEAIPELLSPALPGLRPCGRVVVIGTPPDAAENTGAAVAARALEGVTRSLGKEVRDGATCNLVHVEPGAEDAVESTLRFLLSPRSAYVSGQVVRVGKAPADDRPPDPINWGQPLAGAVALVTGAANGIGAATADVLARDGAHVICLDLPDQADRLHASAAALGGSSLTADLSSEHAPALIGEYVRETHGGLDVVVHNAGITRDRTLARMDADRWSSVVNVNLISVERLTQTLLDHDLLRDGGSIVATSSMNAIAGNRGQTNYAASKAGVIGLVEALTEPLRTTGRRINAVAPGFIETGMTARMPVAVRESGRRLNSLGQGGQPIDVAETAAWLAAPATAGVNGQTLRVCGQGWLGA